MPSKDYPLTKEEFDYIYSKVPRLTVEIILQNQDSAIYLTKRAIEPCKGQWHIPGGTVLFGETLLVAVNRIAKRELNIKVITADQIGYIEYPSHYKNGLDCPIGLVFKVTMYEGDLMPNKEALDSDWFNKMPINIHADQDTFLVTRGFLSQT